MTEIEIGRHVLQPNRQLLLDGEHIHLGPRALEILTVLAAANGEIVTKDELMEAVWGDVTVEENALQVHVTALRKALGEDADRLQTIRGIGYHLELRASEPDCHAPREATAPVPATDRLGAASGSRQLRRKPLLLLVALLLVSLLAWGGTLMLGEDESDEEIALLVSTFEASDSANAQDVALARGITDELIARLRQVDGLIIGSAGANDPVTSGPFEQAHKITGSVARNGDRVRVTVRLQEPNGAVLWIDSYERDLIGLFEMQELIAASIGDALSVSLDVGGNSRRYGGTDNPEAFAAYLQWRANSLDLNPSVSRRYLERAVELDPNYVVALSALAQNLGVAIVSSPSSASVRSLVARMDALSRGAIEARPELAHAHVARGWYHVAVRNLVEADRAFARAEELDPGNSPEIEYQLAVHDLVLGRIEDALAHQRSAEMIDPVARYNPWQATELVYAGRPDQAHSLFLQLAEDPDRNVEAHVWHVATGLLSLDQPNEAVTLLDRHGPAQFSQLISNFDAARLERMSLAELRSQYAELGQAQVASGPMILAGYENRPGLALDLARIAFSKPGGNMLFTLWNPNLAAARRAEGFKQLVTDLGFVEAWRTSGNWSDYCRPLSGDDFECF
ncbi:winged helix-turn-helix domain-containing tetratricopeptide repeat protein [Aurantiacibacter hainanensis]|uniref:winged helix-turn-helix domain-containing tetratricopeptide repeat protein n=1 Tax=Aurantiacibacter hainanensis TaxID=3076114 RepID=UPI0030C72C57